MFEIIPNWHPVFVHFTVALLSLTVVFHGLCPLLPEGTLKLQCGVLARWNLWLGTGFGIITVMAGWFAFNSVVHDGPSHVAMTAHRDWALVTVTLFSVLAGWSCWCQFSRSQSGNLFLVGLLLGGFLLTSTAWRGAELVYRYGLGVMSMPQVESGAHDHGSHHLTESPAHEANPVRPMIQSESAQDHSVSNHDDHDALMPITRENSGGDDHTSPPVSDHDAVLPLNQTGIEEHDHSKHQH